MAGYIQSTVRDYLVLQKPRYRISIHEPAAFVETWKVRHHY
jgi:hypothetical protein